MIFDRVISGPILNWGLIQGLLRADHLATNSGPDRWTYLEPPNLLDLRPGNLNLLATICEASIHCGSFLKAPPDGSLNLSRSEGGIPLFESYEFSFLSGCALYGGDATGAEDGGEEELSRQESCLREVEGSGGHRQELGVR